MSADAPVEAVSASPPPLGGPALLRQRLCDVTFVHWGVPAAQVAPLLPPGTVPDVFRGCSYVGLVALRMRAVGPVGAPSPPWLGDFLQTNVRLYAVDRAGRRGVVFRSMDCERLPFVVGSRLSLGLPYRWSRMRHAVRGDRHVYLTRTRWPGPRGVRSLLAVRAGAGEAADAELGTFLTARWGLHLHRGGRTRYLPVTHEPWPLRPAEVLRLDDGLVAAAGFPALAAHPPVHVAHAAGVAARFGPPQPEHGRPDREQTWPASSSSAPGWAGWRSPPGWPRRGTRSRSASRRRRSAASSAVLPRTGSSSTPDRAC